MDIKDYNKGFIANVKRGVVTRVDTTITGVAETVLGDLNRWRDVLENNPDKLPFKLPPTIQGELDKIKPYTDIIGLKIPPADSIESDLKRRLGVLANPVVLGAVNIVTDAKKESTRILSQIGWLG
jgi:hypothetical protein